MSHLPLRLAVPLLLLMAGCASSRPSESEDGFALYKGDGGDMEVVIGEGASGETMMVALLAAATVGAWDAPQTARGLELVEQTYKGPDFGMLYRYEWGVPSGRFNVYVYSHLEAAEVQIEETRDALAHVRDAGRIDSFALLGTPTVQQINWTDSTAVLHRAVFAETVGGLSYRSYLYLVKPQNHWIKVRATAPSAAVSDESMDALVRDVLTGE